MDRNKRSWAEPDKAHADVTPSEADDVESSAPGHQSRVGTSKFLFELMLLVATTELVAMLLLWHAPFKLPAAWEALADAAFLTGVAGPILWWTSIRPLSLQIDTAVNHAETARAQLHAELMRRDADARVTRALEMADSEDAVFDVVKRAVAAEFVDQSSELLLADSSHAHLHRVLTVGDKAPGCPVSSPRDCVAVRDGYPRTFASSEAIDACPKLVNRGAEPVSATCVPIAILGRSVGVLHIVGAVDAPVVESVPWLSRLMSGTGTRLGLLRALADWELQASTDSLTGLANRRTLENHLNVMKRSGQPYAVLMADLDHFKTLNDTHGHEVGDRALRLFGRVLSESVRSCDLAARYGGEEFVCIIAGGDTNIGILSGERIQRSLREYLADSSVPPFTVSIGVSSTADGADPTGALKEADNAMYEAKRNGRCRVEAALPTELRQPSQVPDPSGPPPPQSDSTVPTLTSPT